MKKRTVSDSERLQSLRKQYNDLRVKVMNLEDKVNRDELAPKLKKLVGKFQKYQNCYSCPQGPEDYWWAYRFVYEVNATGRVKSIEFQTDKYGVFTLQRQERDGRFYQLEGWKNCTKAEFKKALFKADKMLDVIHGEANL